MTSMPNFFLKGKTGFGVYALALNRCICSWIILEICIKMGTPLCVGKAGRLESREARQRGLHEIANFMQIFNKKVHVA